MPKHRSTVYTVVREDNDTEQPTASWGYGALIGTYATHRRADEIAARAMQDMEDRFGVKFAKAFFRFSVQPSTWYDE